MKRKDMFWIALVVVIASMISYSMANKVFNNEEKRTLKAAVVRPIEGELPTVKGDSSYSFFNEQALNPTQLITIGPNQNNAPFNASQ